MWTSVKEACAATARSRLVETFEGLGCVKSAYGVKGKDKETLS